MHDWIGGIPHARHAREYLWPEIHEALAIAGLEVEFETSRHFHLDDPSKLRRVAKLGLDRIAQARKTLGPQIVIVARKPAELRESPAPG